MDKTEIAKIILCSYIADEVENSYPEIVRDFVRSQEDITDTVPDAIGENIFTKAVDEMCQYIVLSKEVQEDEDCTDKEIAFYLLNLEHDLPSDFSNEKNISFDEMEFRNKASDLISFYQNED